MNTGLLKARQTKYVGYVTLYIIVALAIVTIANMLANRYDKSYDATANKQYSLSDQTIKVVKGLKQDATITYFAQDSQFASAKDKLDMYANLSPKLHVVYVDPDKKPLVATQAGFKNLNTAIVQVGGNKNEAKSLSEEDLTGALIRDLKHTTRTVCFITGSGEHQIDDSGRSGYSRFKDLIGKDDYQGKSIDLLQKAEVPSDCTVVVVGGPRGDYQQPEV
ncbi:MAG TPA: Gldg family protein, partial [Candidatus Acidoferrum sp.]